MNLSPARLFGDLERLFPQADFLIAYSGGLDSSVLLHLCAVGAGTENANRFSVIHVNHGLHPQANQWADHGERTCEKLGLCYRILVVDGAAKKGQSPEDAARNARYSALQPWVDKTTVVLTAQHQEDQAETMLLQMLRGSGLKGLSGMPASASFGAGIIHRPLLSYSKNAIRHYAKMHSLNWIEDPSNHDLSINRNYLRHEIIPRIEHRWPGMAKTLSRSARLCAESQKLIDHELVRWFNLVLEPNRNTLLISKLKEYDKARQRCILRHWILQSGFRSPSEINLNRIVSEVNTAAPDRFPKVHWGEAEVRRYRNELFIMKPLENFSPPSSITWSLSQPLEIPGLQGKLEFLPDNASTSGEGIVETSLSIRFRSGGERCRLPGRRGSRSLKKIYQELGVPPWERDRIPLIYINGELAVVGNLLVCEAYQHFENVFRWTEVPD